MSSADRGADTSAVGRRRRRPTSRRRRRHTVPRWRRRTSRRCRAVARRDDGAQALELAMVMPLVLLVLVGVVGVGVLGAAAVHTQALAVRLARQAAVMDDATVRASLGAGADVEVAIDPPTGVRTPGVLLTVRVRRTVVLSGLGPLTVPLEATATAVTEDAP